MQTASKSSSGRRQFLKQAVAMGGGSVLVVFAAGEAGRQPSLPDAAVGAGEGGHKGYRLTDHIRKYYDTTLS